MARQEDEEQISVWINKLTDGDPQAAAMIWQAYFQKIQRYAKRKLKDMPRRSSDEEDIAQSAFNSFFQAAQSEKFPKLADRDDLWKILVTITARKATAYQRRHFADKRGGGQIRGESVFIDKNEPTAGLHQFLGSEPPPQLVAEMEEEFERLLQMLPDVSLREIAEWKFQGFSNEEIAQKIGRNVRTVERKLGLIRDAWSESCSELELDVDAK